MQPPTDDSTNLGAAGLWRNNAALVQLLGLCPLLAVTTSVVNGLALGVATLGVLVVTNTLVSLTRRALLPSVRIPLFLLIIGALVTCVDLLSNALLDDLHTALGLFIPLIVTNCAILAQAETVAARRGLAASLVAAVATGSGFLGVLVTLGALRELIGHGTLLAGLPMLAGGGGGEWRLVDLPVDGMLVAVLPPGAFFGLALLLALRNFATRERSPAAAQASPRSTEPAA